MESVHPIPDLVCTRCGTMENVAYSSQLDATLCGQCFGATSLHSISRPPTGSRSHGPHPFTDKREGLALPVIEVAA